MAEDVPSIQTINAQKKDLGAVDPMKQQIASQWSSLINRQNALVSCIRAQGCQIIAEVGLLALRVQQSSSRHNKALEADHTPPVDRVVRILSGLNPVFKYQLTLEGDLPRPLSKERAFRLEARVLDMKGHPVTLPEPQLFQIVLFTSETTPKLLTVNRSGQHLLTGGTSHSNGRVVFPKVVLNEVSSHFENGTLLLAVAASRGVMVKPLVIDGVVIKARRSLNQDTRKKAKLSNLT